MTSSHIPLSQSVALLDRVDVAREHPSTRPHALLAHVLALGESLGTPVSETEAAQAVVEHLQLTVPQHGEEALSPSLHESIFAPLTLDRPANVTDWQRRVDEARFEKEQTTQVLTQLKERAIAHVNRFDTKVKWAILGMCCSVPVGLCALLTSSPLFGFVMGMVAASSLVVMACFAMTWEKTRDDERFKPHILGAEQSLRELDRREDALTPVPSEDLPSAKTVKRWSRYPEMVKALRTIHASGVPLLSQDLNALLDWEEEAEEQRRADKRARRGDEWRTALQALTEQ